ncbi:hypothetical protein JW926_16110 [Candidatus Sumerlaeota bacterium]|nr:hypothetical protein [Candidatus Sumerlaeota bacterium]
MKKSLFILLVIFIGSFGLCQGSFTPPILEGKPNKIVKTLQGITFNSDYDNGSLKDVVDLGPDEYRCDLYTEQGEIGPRQFWFRFKMSGVSGRNIKLHINHRHNPFPVISLDGVNWRRLHEREAPSLSEIILNFFPWENHAELALFFPLGVEETYSRVNHLVRRCDDATSRILGKSFCGRDLWMITVEDASSANTQKFRIWLQSRVHAGEVPSTHAMLGFLDLITSDTREALLLRRHCVFNIVPLVNVDGVYMGLSRWDSRGIDPEHIWGNPERTSETLLIKYQIDEFMASDNPIRVSLNLHSTVSNNKDTFFFKHVAPSVTEEFELIQQGYIDALDNATPLFDNLCPHSSQLHPFNYLESYFWSNWGKEVMAITHEGHFYRRLPDGKWITDEDYRKLGSAMAVALIEYFKLYYKNP